MGASASIENPESVWELVAKIKAENPGNRTTKYLTKEYYDSLSPEQQAVFQKCVRTGIDNPTSGLGCYAMQPSDYDTFGTFFDQVRSNFLPLREWLTVCALLLLWGDVQNRVRVCFSFFILPQKKHQISFGKERETTTATATAGHTYHPTTPPPSVPPFCCVPSLT